MSWNGEQFNRPLIMLQRYDVKTLRERTGYAPDDEVAALFPVEGIGAELALIILMKMGQTEAAVELLSHAINPRVGVWWAYRCQQMVDKDIADDFAKDGLTPAERLQKRMDALQKQLGDTSDIDAMVNDLHARIEDEEKQIREQLKDCGYVNPLERVQKKTEMIMAELKEFFKDEPDDSHLGENPLLGKLFKQMQQEAEAEMDRLIDDMMPKPEPEQPAMKIYEAIKAKTDAVKPAIDAEMAKYFPLKMRGLPKPPGPEKKTAAVEAALRWLLVPSDENGRLACNAAIAAQSGPESMLAYAAFWSSTNLVTETGMVPTNPSLPPQGISKTLLQLALAEGGELDYDQRYAEFLRLGIECADGTCTWDEYGNPVVTTPLLPPTGTPNTLGARYGFGRS